MTSELDQLLAENERLKAEARERAREDEVQPGGKAGIFVWAAVIMSAITLIAIGTIYVTRPEKDNTQLNTMILAFTAPTILALMTGAIQQVHMAVNSRLTQLVRVVSKARFAEGQLAASATGSPVVAHEQGKAEGVEQERVRTDEQK